MHVRSVFLSVCEDAFHLLSQLLSVLKITLAQI